MKWQLILKSRNTNADILFVLALKLLLQAQWTDDVLEYTSIMFHAFQKYIWI